jgi:hypothetical protein
MDMKGIPDMKKQFPFISALALAALFFLFGLAHFLPYFDCGSDEPISLARYLWLEPDNAELNSYLASNIEDYNIRSIVVSGFFLPLIGTVLAIILLVYKKNIPFTVLSFFWGIWGILGYVLNDALRLGGFPFYISIVLFSLVILTSVARIVLIRPEKHTY